MTTSASLPPAFDGILIANELLDAMPVHQVVMRESGLREVFVSSTDLSDPRSSGGGSSNGRSKSESIEFLC